MQRLEAGPRKTIYFDRPAVDRGDPAYVIRCDGDVFRARRWECDGAVGVQSAVRLWPDGPHGVVYTNRAVVLDGPEVAA